jgi:hypothetical protein
MCTRIARVNRFGTIFRNRIEENAAPACTPLDRAQANTVASGGEMAKKLRTRKLRLLKPRHGRAITYCGAPCDLEKGTVCEDCKEWRRMRRSKAGQYDGESS